MTLTRAKRKNGGVQQSSGLARWRPPNVRQSPAGPSSPGPMLIPLARREAAGQAVASAAPADFSRFRPTSLVPKHVGPSWVPFRPCGFPLSVVCKMQFKVTLSLRSMALEWDLGHANARSETTRLFWVPCRRLRAPPPSKPHRPEASRLGQSTSQLTYGYRKQVALAQSRLR